MFGAAAAATPSYNPNKDTEIAQPPSDGITSLSWSPRANHLVATSWDNNVYCWEVLPNGTSQAKASTSHAQPVLCSAWNADGTAVFTGGCDKMVKMWNLATNQSSQVAQHDAPVRHCFFIPNMNMLVTGGWDKTIRYWDMRSPSPVHTQQLPERVYAMDVNHPLLVVGLADRQIQVYNLSQPQTPYKTQQSPLKFQTRCVTAFPDRQGYLVGSIEGRVGVHHIEDSDTTKNFTFKCHRDNNDIYAVNTISFHPQMGTFSTAGSDGTYNFWDKDSKQRLKAMNRCWYAPGQPAPITAAAFNSAGNVFAYTLSYDWSKGYAEYNPATMKNYIMLHAVQEVEVKARAKPANAGRK